MSFHGARQFLVARQSWPRYAWILAVVVAACAVAPEGHSPATDHSMVGGEALGRADCQHAGCGDTTVAPGEVESWMQVANDGAIRCGSRIRYSGRVRVDDVRALLEADWSTWWPESRVRGRTQALSATRFAFNPYYFGGIAPVRVIVESRRQPVSPGTRHITTYALRLGGDFEGDARLVVEEVPGGVTVWSIWDQVFARGIYALSPRTSASLHLLREAIGLRALIASLPPP